ncbi:hypothetical protein [Paratissierella segnis]|jgi:hypothetical protein|uniref:Uncharacterized protein n=1 Tax=Paratissierella segnis TaxID=2763679 RepID=A0A926IL08_9FIRM|nr:hypothetical protein [Paratissierella segnis]MBC8588870.1 hypothetical protein [Paratissierella segnis]
MNIIKPTNSEKENAIENILSKGLSKPDGLMQFSNKIYRTLGFKFIFFDISQAIIMAVAVTVGFFLLYSLSSPRNVYSTLYAVSPLFFITVVFLTEFFERNGSLYELKMTFKYTIQEVIIFRILCYSLISMVICIFISISIPDKYNFLRAVSITLSALFICAAFTIYIMRNFNGRWVHFTSLVVWVTIVLLPVLILGESWELLLSQIPIGITLTVSVIGFILYLNEIKKLINMNKMEVQYYVGS